MDRTEYGLVHSNIESTPGTTVVDEGTGDEIASGVQFQGGTGLRIGGQMFKAREWRDQVLQVRRTDDPNEAVGAWSYTTRRWMRGAGQPHAVRKYLGIAENEFSLLSHDGMIFAFHWGGGRRKAVIELLRTQAGERKVEGVVNEWCLILPCPAGAKPGFLTAMSAAALSLEVGDRLDQLEHWLGRPLANKRLPYAVRHDEVQRWLQLDQEVEWLSGAAWYQVNEPNVSVGLRLIAKQFC
jgi:hypothetical protein